MWGRPTFSYLYIIADERARFPFHLAFSLSAFFVMKKYAESFYKSKAWQKCRADFFKYKKGLCEKCLEKGIITPGEIVHHKIPIDRKNINDPNITLSFNNLQLLCRECHAQAHGSAPKRVYIDECGRVIPNECRLLYNG